MRLRLAELANGRVQPEIDGPLVLTKGFVGIVPSPRRGGQGVAVERYGSYGLNSPVAESYHQPALASPLGTRLPAPLHALT